MLQFSRRFRREKTALGTFIATIAFSTTLASPAVAGPSLAKEPKKASELLTIFGDSGTPCVNATGVLVDKRLLADGTVQPLTISQKQVLVVTSARVEITGGTAGQANEVQLLYDIPSPTGITVGDFENYAGGTGAGSSTRSFNFVAKQGVDICCAVTDGTLTDCVLDAFLAKDK